MSLLTERLTGLKYGESIQGQNINLQINESLIIFSLSLNERMSEAWLVTEARGKYIVISMKVKTELFSDPKSEIILMSIVLNQLLINVHNTHF